MKTISLILWIPLIATAVFAQGTVVFNNRVFGTIMARVYEPDPAHPWSEQFGNTPTDYPPGTNAYSGAPLSGSGWTAELWAAPGIDAPESSLLPATPTTTFRTGAAAGYVAETMVTLAGVPQGAPWATMQMRVFPSIFSSWGAAEAAWLGGDTSAIGKSPTFSVAQIGDVLNPPPYLVGLVTFSLVAIPEPSAFALLSLGAFALLVTRRRR